MRILELAYIAAVTLTTLTIFIFPVKNLPIKYGTYVAIIVLATIHFAVDGFRWQMAPSYFLGILTLFLLKIREKNEYFFSARWKRNSFILFLTFWIPITIFLPVLFPVFNLTHPSGPYQSGRTFFSDAEVTVWYPTVEYSKKAPYFDEKNIEALQNNHQIPFFLLSYLKDVKTHSQEGVSLAIKEDKFPVILLSHVFQDANFLYTGIAEELSSNGYIVVVTGQIANDQKHVINSLNQQSPIFKGKMDLTKIGVISHTEESSTDTFPKEEQVLATINMSQNRMIFEKKDTSYIATINGTKHMSFSDYYLYSPLLSILDKVNHREDQKIISSLITQFFNKSFYGEKNTIFDNGKKTYYRLNISNRK